MLIYDQKDSNLIDIDDSNPQPAHSSNLSAMGSATASAAESSTVSPASSAASSSQAAPLPIKGAPPSFADSNYFVPPGGEAPPPDFAPYAADYFESGDGCVVSHDPHLNQDGEALYRFLLSQSQTPPQLLLYLHGEHQEHRSRSVRRVDDRGHTSWHTETETVTVVDFDFHVDVSQHIMARPVQWSIPDEEPAYRGAMDLEVDGILMPTNHHGMDAHDSLLETERRRRWSATKQEKKQAKMWEVERQKRGLPPWVGPTVGGPQTAGMHQGDVLRSTKTVRQWADEYCASRKMLKEFTYKKVVYGWNLASLEAAVTAAVKSTYYDGSLTVKFQQRADKVYIRADNWLSRILSRKWLVVLLWLTLLYPIIWLFKRFSSGGGGRWEVCGGAYALKSWRLVSPADDDPPPPFPGDDGSYSYNGRTLLNTPMGMAEMVGVKEGEWFQRWEGTIKRAVMGRCQSPMPLRIPDDGPLPAAMMLDGYQPQTSSSQRGFLPLMG